MKMIYKSEPPRSMDPNHIELTDDDLVWQWHSLPLGNGYLGACVYGYEDDDRIQLTDNSFGNPYKRVPTNRSRMTCGLTSFANIYLHFGHGEVEEYHRELDLDRAVCTVTYKVGGVSYKREYFTSYPDRVLAVKITVDKPKSLNLTVSAEIPYIGDYAHSPEDNMVRTGRVYTADGRLVMESELDFYEVKGYGVASVKTDGTVGVTDSAIRVEAASEVVLLYTMGTNYRMESRVFTEPDAKKKLAPYPHPKNEVDERIKSLEAIDYNTLYERHVADHSALFSRSSLVIGEGGDTPIADLLAEAKAGNPSVKLACYLYAYGRYLLIASSRRGALPANLQGVWTNYRSSPWSAGYWHNINVQMNYWPSAPTNIAECFLSYSDYNTAYMDSARDMADAYIRQQYPEREIKPHENGWIIGTGAWPYLISGAGGHSGPGTGAFTSLLFWDYYDFTRDEEYLREKAYPVLRDMSLFFSKTLDKYGDKYLVTHSASPEQFGKDGKYYATVGCAFDQQMIYENYKRTLEAAEILGIDEPLLDTIREQIDRLDPILIGLDGQIKEFREEEHYGDIGEEKHRHISHLVAVYPGCSVNEKTPEFMDAAGYSLMRRGDGSSGWSASHRLLCYARLGDGEACYRIVKRFMSSYVTDNLWTQHPPFQIDGSFGITAGIAEMLLQSHGGYIRLLPAIPAEWVDGKFTGLVARGNFVFDCEFKGGRPVDVTVTCRSGGRLELRGDFVGASVEFDGTAQVTDTVITAETKVGDVIRIINKK